MFEFLEIGIHVCRLPSSHIISRLHRYKRGNIRMRATQRAVQHKPNFDNLEISLVLQYDCLIV